MFCRELVYVITTKLELEIRCEILERNIELTFVRILRGILCNKYKHNNGDNNDYNEFVILYHVMSCHVMLCYTMLR